MNKIKSNWANILIIFASFLLINLNVVNFGDDYGFLDLEIMILLKHFPSYLIFIKQQMEDLLFIFSLYIF